MGNINHTLSLGSSGDDSRSIYDNCRENEQRPAQNTKVDLEVSVRMKSAFIQSLRKYFIFPNRKWFITMYLKTTPRLDNGSIIDIETTGLKPGKGNYCIPPSHIITLGIYQGDLIRIYQLTKRNYVGFLRVCRKIVEKTPKPRYAYAAHFEQSFLGIIEGWQDLTRYREVEYDEWQPWRSVRYSLMDVTRNPCPSREDWDIEGSEAPATWEKWLKTGKIDLLGEIAYHCYIDLLRERQLT